MPKTGPSSAEPLDAVGARYGFRRVEQVELAVDGGTPRARVTGVVHRYPRSVPVPLRVAAELIAAGAPLRQRVE